MIGTIGGGFFVLIRWAISFYFKKNNQFETLKQEHRKTVVGNIEANQDRLATDLKEFQGETKKELGDIKGIIGKTREEVAELRGQNKSMVETQKEIKDDFKDFHLKTKQLLTVCMGRLDDLEKSRMIRLGPNSVMIKGKKGE